MKSYIPLQTRLREFLPRAVKAAKQVPNVNFSVQYNDPETVEDVLSGKNASCWKQSMQKEFQSLKDNNTWTLVDLPAGKKAINCKWVFKRNFDSNGLTSRYKSTLDDIRHN